MIRIKMQKRSFPKQLIIISKNILKAKRLWGYSIILAAILFLANSYFYQYFSVTGKYIFNSIISILFFLPYLYLIILACKTNPGLKKEGDVWLFLDDKYFGRESDFSKATYKWNQIDTINEDCDFILFTQKGKSKFIIDKFSHPEETISAITKLLSSVPVENIQLLK